MSGTQFGTTMTTLETTKSESLENGKNPSGLVYGLLSETHFIENGKGNHGRLRTLRQGRQEIDPEVRLVFERVCWLALDTETG